MRSRTIGLAAALTVSGLLAGACASSSSGASTSGGSAVKIGLSTTLSGSIAGLGQTGMHGAQLAVDDLNAKGGVLGKQVHLVTADDAAKPENGTTNARNMILDDHVVALLGPVSSAVAAAEEGVAAQHRIPIFFHTSNDLSLTTKSFTKYAFQVVPNTYMEPRAVASYLANKPYKRYYTIAPDYVFGHDTVQTFLSSLKDFGASPQVVGQQWPALGTTDYSSYISAALSAKPDFVFIVNYGGDLITLAKQATGYGLFTKTHVGAQFSIDTLKGLGDSAPAGTIAWSRAPFFAIDTPGVKQFVDAYKAKYHEVPSDWSLLAYTAVQSWAAGAQKAGSFDGDKVSAALSGASVSTIRGNLTFRACDHMANVPEYVGTIASSVDATYGIRTFDNLAAPDPSKIMMSCSQATALQHG